ncbi:MAG: hypothetical protein Q8Q46_00050 [Candidatus Giovannonibacteria bacterium]|nr:hypothetical protein [Candidatus Giovannonibacteria bacterium]
MKETFSPESGREKSPFEKYNEFLDIQKRVICTSARNAIFQAGIACSLAALGTYSIAKGDAGLGIGYLSAAGAMAFASFAGYKAVEAGTEEMRKIKSERHG